MPIPKKINKNKMFAAITYQQQTLNTPIVNVSAKTPGGPVLNNIQFHSVPKIVQQRRSSNYYANLPYHKFKLPHGVLVQEVNNRQSKLCKSCDKKPEGKRLLVMYFQPLNHRISTEVYCQDCAKDFLRECDKEYNVLVAELRDGLKK